MKQKNTIPINKASIKLFEAMLCELIQTYMDLFHQGPPPNTSCFLSKEIQLFGEAEFGNAEAQPNKE